MFTLYICISEKNPNPEIGKHLKSKATLNSFRTSYLVSVLKRSLGEHQLPCLYEVTCQQLADLASFGCKKPVSQCQIEETLRETLENHQRIILHYF